MNMYPAADSADKSSDAPSGDENEQESALLPKSLFGGDCKVGDVYKVKVVAIHDDELEVEPAGEEKTDKQESSEEEDDMGNPVDALMSKQME